MLLLNKWECTTVNVDTYPISESSLHILFYKVQAAFNVIEANSSFIGLVSNFVHSVWDITGLLLRR